MPDKRGRGRPKGKTVYDPERHCGAKNTLGEPCVLTKHWGLTEERKQQNIARGNFRCKYHGGMSTGSKTKRGKEKSAQNLRKHGFYAATMTGADKVNYDAAKEHPTPDLLMEGVYIAHAKLRRILADDNGARYSREAKTVLQACDILLEQEEISPEFVDDLKLKLLNLDIERLLGIFQRSGSLAQQAMMVDQMGNLKARSTILERFLIQVAQQSSERHVRELVAHTISLLKLEAGLPSEMLDELVRAGLELESAEGDEDVVEVDSEEV